MNKIRKSLGRIFEYAIWAGTGAFIALFYSFLVPLLVELFAGFFGMRLGVLNAFFNSPFAIGFVGCLGAYHFGRQNGFKEGVDWGRRNEQAHQEAMATINSWHNSRNDT